MDKIRLLLACLLALAGAAALAGEPVKLLLVTGVTPVSEQGDLVQLVDRKKSECRYFGRLVQKPQPQETTRDKAKGLLSSNVGEWWLDIRERACQSADKVTTGPIHLRVLLNPMGSYPPGTEVTASVLD